MASTAILFIIVLLIFAWSALNLAAASDISSDALLRKWDEEKEMFRKLNLADGDTCKRVNGRWVIFRSGCKTRKIEPQTV